MTTHVVDRADGGRVSRSRARQGERGPRLVPLVFFTMLVIVLFFSMIYLRIALDRTAFELDSLERGISLEESRQLDLRLEIAQLQDPIRIVTEAERIGLEHPTERVPLAIAEVAEPIPLPGEEDGVKALDDRSP